MFITLEGIEGSGKTTQMDHLRNFLDAAGLPAVFTREPGGTRLGGKIRTILLDSGNGSMDPLAELLLYFADRAQHLAEIVRPALAAGNIVVCDRYVDATLVYQGVARGIGTELVKRLHALVCGGLTPDLTFLLDLPTEVGLGRAWQAIQNGARQTDQSRFEEENQAFHQAVRSGYLDLARKAPHRFQIIDANRDVGRVRADIVERLTAFFNERRPPQNDGPTKDAAAK